MNTRCLCAEQRASESAAHIDRLNARVDALRRQWREQMDISDTARVQANELRRLLDQERESKLALVAALDGSLSREAAMREVVTTHQSALAASQGAVDTMAEQISDRDRQIAELKERTIENAKQARGTDQPPWRRESARHGEVLPSC